MFSLGKVEKLFAQLTRSLEICPEKMMYPEPPQDRGKLRTRSHLPAKLLRSGVDIPHFWGSPALDRYESWPQSDLQREFVLCALGSNR